jgi:hypothetical protein
MREPLAGLSSWGAKAIVLCALSACAARSPLQRPMTAPEQAQDTPMPTVPPAPPTPAPEAAPLATRPVGKPVKPRKGVAIGPLVTFLGVARADGSSVEPASVDRNGTPTYTTAVGSGFMIVVEGKPGESGLEVGRRVFAYVPDDPKIRPDLEIESSRDMGNGSTAVCDRRRPHIGGIPGIRPASFAETQRISDALNDFACRFETFIESASSCTMTPNGDYSFAKTDSTTQFCMIVARAYAFPVGETIVSARLRDSAGNPGPVKRMRILRPAAPATGK